MTALSEHALESITLTCFRHLCHDYHHGLIIAPNGETPERQDYSQVILPTAAGYGWSEKTSSL